MVRFHTFLLALIFAMGLVLASSDGYHRRVDKHALVDERPGSGTFDESKSPSLLGSTQHIPAEYRSERPLSYYSNVGDEVGEKAINLLNGRVGTDIPERRSTVRREPAVGNLRPQKKLSKQQEPLKKQLNNKAQLEKSNFKLNENAVTGRSRGPGLRPARMLAGRGDGDDKGCVVC